MPDAGAYVTAGIAPPADVSALGPGISGPYTRQNPDPYGRVDYQVGPFGFGAESPLGIFFNGIRPLADSLGFQDPLNNLNRGLALQVNNPQAAGFLLRADLDQQLTPAQIQAVKSAETKNLSSNPITAVSQIIGGVFGTGVEVAGQVVGGAGQAAAFPVSAGAQQGVGGVAQVAGAGASGAFGGAIQGLGSGLSTTLGANAGNPTLIFVAVVVLVIILTSR